MSIQAFFYKLNKFRSVHVCLCMMFYTPLTLNCALSLKSNRSYSLYMQRPRQQSNFKGSCMYDKKNLTPVGISYEIHETRRILIHRIHLK